MIKKAFQIVLWISLSALPLWSLAQEDPCNDPFNPNPDDPACDPDIYVPIDGGVSALLVGGILLGARAYRNRKTKEEESSPI
ncbi:PID-CTERM protein-sorting domain-containing protein [Pedobacter glucosidilyticus]|uniref:PID-CTERM protein-sorting domain-containing protein n=1 Tax=Pedobacter glucosidilyticus TaxID=1122941 RepID=UPI0003FA478D|nr:hypothetical protein [Pedobacter glucosidilyticus]